MLRIPAYTRTQLVYCACSSKSELRVTYVSKKAKQTKQKKFADGDITDTELVGVVSSLLDIPKLIQAQSPVEIDVIAAEMNLVYFSILRATRGSTNKFEASFLLLLRASLHVSSCLT